MLPYLVYSPRWYATALRVYMTHAGSQCLNPGTLQPTTSLSDYISGAGFWVPAQVLHLSGTEGARRRLLSPVHHFCCIQDLIDRCTWA